MYLIIKDPTARTVRFERRKSDYLRWIKADPLLCFTDKESAEETAKSIAIKENLIYTPQIEY